MFFLIRGVSTKCFFLIEGDPQNVFSYKRGNHIMGYPHNVFSYKRGIHKMFFLIRGVSTKC